jgi:hypothetical protein
MLQFAANLGFLFQEVDLLARYNAAAGAGFRGVETPFPYRVPPRRSPRVCSRVVSHRCSATFPQAIGTLVSVALVLYQAGKRLLPRVLHRP